MDNFPSLIALRLFTRVAALGSFTQAALEAGLPASSVSRHIAGLEKHLDQRLLYRHTRAVRLTDAGERYCTQVREALECIDLAGETLNGPAGEPRGILTLNAPAALGRLHLLPLIVLFRQRYPNIQVELNLSDQFIDPVQADLTLRVGRLEDASYVARPLGVQRWVLCAAPHYLAQRGAPGTPADLSAHDCLLYKGQHGTRRWYFRGPGQAHFTAVVERGVLTSNDGEALVAAACQGHGVVLFPTWLVYHALRDGRLVPLLHTYEGSEDTEPMPLHLLYPHARYLAPKVQLFRDFLLDAVGQPPYWDHWRGEAPHS